MTDTPLSDDPRWSFGGKVPQLDARSLDELASAAGAKAAETVRSPWVLAEPVPDDPDPAVFGVAFAVQRIQGEPWLVRGLLRTVADRPPVMCRVVVEHFRDPTREVTGSVMRDINFGTIRDDALERLRQKHHSLSILGGAGWPISTPSAAAAKRAADEADKHTLARGPRGGYPAEHYRHIARRYLALVAAGRRDVQKALREEESERLGKPIGRERMRDWVRKATGRGFLAPGKPGVTGREPGPNLDTEGGNDG